MSATKENVLKDIKEAKKVLDDIHNMNLDHFSDAEVEELNSLTLFLHWIESGQVAHAYSMEESKEKSTVESAESNIDFEFSNFASFDNSHTNPLSELKISVDLQEDVTGIAKSIENTLTKEHSLELGLEGC